MKFGNLDALVNATEKVVYDSGELTTTQTTITISGLDGDVDEEYTLYARVVNGYNGAVIYYLRPNNDSTANIYGRQYISGDAAVASAGRSTHAGIIANYAGALSEQSLSKINLYSKSGYVRTAIQKYSHSIVTLTVGGIVLSGWAYNETSNNITSLVYVADQVGGLGVGSRIIVTKKVVATTGKRTGVMNVGSALANGVVNRTTQIKGQWQSIYKNTLTATATSITITGLDGDTDVMYRLKIRAVNGYSGNAGIRVQPNGDSGTNYGYQQFVGQDTAVAAARNTDTGITAISGMNGLGTMGDSNALIYAKSGYVRTAIAMQAYTISTTTVTGIAMRGYSWNNTADNITSLVILASQVGGLGIGTEIELERLIPS